MNAPSVARHGFVSGRVQGVAFRYYARDQALAFGVEGWIRNLVDRRVEFFVQGSFGHVSAFIDWLHQGPPMSRVSDVEVEDVAVEKGLSGFEIRR